MTGAVYLDTSALVKLVFEEAETWALVEFLRRWPDRVSSALASVELARVVRSVQDAAVEREAHRLLKRVSLMKLDESLLSHASTAEPRTLRTLDAIHLATARSLGRHMAGMVTYDRKMADAARHYGITVWAPA